MTHLHQQPDLFGQFITSEHSLDRTADAFDALATNPDEVKVLINPTGTA
jgi:hypothetical protein